MESRAGWQVVVDTFMLMHMILYAYARTNAHAQVADTHIRPHLLLPSPGPKSWPQGWQGWSWKSAEGHWHQGEPG